MLHIIQLSSLLKLSYLYAERVKNDVHSICPLEQSHFCYKCKHINRMQFIINETSFYYILLSSAAGAPNARNAGLGGNKDKQGQISFICFGNYWLYIFLMPFEWFIPMKLNYINGLRKREEKISKSISRLIAFLLHLLHQFRKKWKSCITISPLLTIGFKVAMTLKFQRVPLSVK